MNTERHRSRQAVPGGPRGLRLKPLAIAVRCAFTAALASATGVEVSATELPVAEAAFAALGRADHAVTGNTLNVIQHTERAILDWKSFNVGGDARVRFDQPSASSIALNRIHQNDPSRILGTISANGQIYLVNQNGFVFGKDSRVDVNALVASTLSISEDNFQRGITKVFDQDGRPALTADGTVFRGGENGKPEKIGIEVEAGARIQSAQSGRILLAAPSVKNRGKLSAPDGQIVMVGASDKVYLQEVGGDPGMRGLRVEVGSGGEVANLGKLLADRGNASLVGFAVNQQGRISAQTAVRANGSIRLLAREGAMARRESDRWVLEATRSRRGEDGGDGLGTRSRVVLAKGSLTEATPNLADKATAVDGQAQERSRIEVMGHQVELHDGAVLRSRSGQVGIVATEHPDAPAAVGVRNDSRLLVDASATVDVSGIKRVALPMERNVAELELRSNELRDAPLQKTGVLYGKKVRVDIRKGTEVADILGALERIGRTVAERSTAGGLLKLGSEGDAVIEHGALLDFSGGSLFYRPGYLNTTQLVQDRRIVDIGDADPNVRYDALLGDIEKTYRRWGITRRWNAPGAGGLGRFESGYVEGKAAGKLDIAANGLILNGTLRAGAVSGLHQREAGRQVPGGELSIDLARTPDSVQPLVLGTSRTVAAADSAAPPLVLADDFMISTGLGKATLATAGKVLVEADARVRVPDGGALSLTGGEVKVAGILQGPSAAIELATRLTGSTQGSLSGAVELGPKARIDTSGRWVNDLPDPRAKPYLGEVFKDGGSVQVAAQGEVRMETGSRIDVSGGAWRRGDGKVQAGDAGSIDLKAAAPDGSNLVLAGEMAAYALSGGNGGRLALTSADILIGEPSRTPAANGDGAGPLNLAPEFFRRGGFESFAIASNESGVTVLADAQLAVQAENRLLDTAFTRRPSGSSLEDFSHVGLLPEIARNPGKIELTLLRTVGAGNGDAAVSVESGAAIRTDAQGSVALVSDTNIYVKGSIEAPAGTLSLRVTPPAVSDPGFLADQGIWIGPGASLSAKGRALTVYDPLGRITGDVQAGGEISLHADRGFVNVLRGARIDASGTAALIDVPSDQQLDAGLAKRRSIPSDGGTIDLRAAEGMHLFGDLTAKAGPGAGAAGGTLSIALNKRTRNEPDPVAPGQQPFPDNPGVIRLTAAEIEAAGSDVAMGAPTPVSEFGRVSLPQSVVEQGGFASLSLVSPDRIEFQGPVSLKTARSITLDAPVLAAQPGADRSAAVAIETAYLALGSTQTRPGELAPSLGPASLSAHAGLIDLVGSQVLSGFSRADLASDGDLRLTGVRTAQDQRDFTGEFRAAGNLSLAADQIYPTTLSDFRIAVANTPGGTLTLLPGDDPSPVLSAGGKLTLEAPDIAQGGVVKAPLGQLTLAATNSLTLASGSVTSNAGDGQLIPFGRTQGGLDWIYPLGTQNLVYSVGSAGTALPPPQKMLSLTGKSVTVAAGAVADSSGGGDLFAFEFIPGPGGSTDILEGGDSPGKYAVLPGFEGEVAPYDPVESSASGLQVGDSVHLAGGGGLKGGDYVLLPAHYALLPGAYLLSEEPGTRDFLPGSQRRNGQGDALIAGYRKVAGTDLHAARWTGFAVTPRDGVRSRAEYTLSRGNDFFEAQAARKKQDAPMLPRDAGTLRVAADTALSLAGTVLAESGKSGQGGLIDIEANRLQVVSATARGGAIPGTVALTDTELNRLRVASVLIGGVRDSGESGTLLKTRAESVTVGRQVDLHGPEVMLTAQDALTVEEGARISGTGPRRDANPMQALQWEGSGALLRVSSGAPVDVRRSAADGAKGTLSVAAGAVLAADGSMNLEASGEAQLRGSLAMQGGSLSVGARHIGVGKTDAGNAGLLLESAQLESLALDELILSSPDPIGVYSAFEVKLGRLEWRSPGIDGFGAAGQTARIDADRLLLTNPGTAPSSAPATGMGNIEFNARQIELGEGSYRLSGFAHGTVRATERLLGTGSGTLQATVDLSFAAPVWSSGPAADTRIEAARHSVSVARTASAAASGEPQALGGRLAIEAAHLGYAGNILLPSGQVALTARSGDLNLESGSTIDVSGRTLGSGASAVLTDGGTVALSTAGNILFKRSARLDLRGQRGGSLQVLAPNGRFVFAGDADAHGASLPGSFALDAAIAESGAAGSGLLSKLESAGFGDGIHIRVRQGDLELGSKDRLGGRDLRLTTDTGSLRILGTLTAKGPGAQLDLEAGDTLELAPTARLQAEGMEGQAGSVRLEAVDGDGDGVSGIALSAGAGIDVGPADGATGAGSVQLAAQRSGGDVAVSGDLRGAVVGTDDITVAAVRTYRHAGAITPNDIDGWEADTLAYMSRAEMIERRLGVPGGLRPGITVKSEGDLNLSAAGWDLSGQRYGGRPGVLALEAAGDLKVDGTLSDGFLAYDPTGIDLSALLGPGAVMPVKDMLLPGSSWSYRLSAGGDVTLASGATVRTGTGDIAVSAGRDFVLADDTAALYTAGRPSTDARYGSFKPSFVAFGFFGEYPVDGGNIRIEAGRDVHGALTDQFFDDWFVQTGNWSRDATHGEETPTAWAIALGQVDTRFDGQPLQASVFRQNVGALGGGDVDIRAGRDVADLSVMLPTSGKQTGQAARPDSPANTDFVENRVEVSQGGNLQLAAGRNVRGGVYYAGRGTASIHAGGGITESAPGEAAVLAIGDSRFDLQAGGDIVVGTVLNPTVIAGAGNASHFFTYTDRSALSLQSLAGKVTLKNDVDGLLSALNGRRDPADSLEFSTAARKAFSVYPGSLEVSALQGGIGVEHSFVTFPSSTGRFTLAAGQGIGSGASGTNVTVLQSDAEAALLPSVEHPARSFLDASQRLNPFGSATLIHAATPVHGTDAAVARIDAGTDGIVARDPILFSLATPVDVQAGGDMRDVSFKIQHADVRTSSIEIGGDLSFTTPRDASGNLLNLVRGIELSGPGQLWINAGGGVDLGTAQGIYSLGNTFNPALPEAGAAISLLVGLKSPVDFEGFAKTYDPHAAVYRSPLLAYLRKHTGDATLSDVEAASAYDRLPETEQHEFLLNLFFGELRAAAVKAASSGRKQDYERGFAAIQALFPEQGNRDGTRYGGDLSLYFSKIHTVDGGDINLLVPCGEINAGLAVSFSGAKPASELGIVAQREGAINAFADGDFQVNQSRVFAMNGGDITVWSANGNIDAGRGAKSAIAAPPPVVSFDNQGNLKVEFPPVVSGSGIRTAASTDGVTPGDVFLAAPKGVVDAGEAGIGGNNVTIAATAVIGASNINVGGIASGIPVATVALPAIPAGAESTAASAAQAAQQSAMPAESLEKSAIRQVAAAPILSRLEVELVGFGDCSVRDVRDGKPGCGG